jgi:hypothetical protein
MRKKNKCPDVEMLNLPLGVNANTPFSATAEAGLTSILDDRWLELLSFHALGY